MAWNKYRAKEQALEIQKAALAKQRDLLEDERDRYKAWYEREAEVGRELREKLIELRKSIPRKVRVENGADLVLFRELCDPKVYQDDGWLHVDHADGQLCFKEWTAYNVENPE